LRYAAILLEMGVLSFQADFARDLSQLAAFRRSIASWLDAAGINPETRNDIVLATHEAVANAMEHAQQEGPINVRGEIANDAVTISVSNAGGWRPPNSNELRGRGLAVIRALMTNMDVEAGSHVSVVLQRSIVS
jgi:serine/threonine-protein kinase RsbW